MIKAQVLSKRLKTSIQANYWLKPAKAVILISDNVDFKYKKYCNRLGWSLFNDQEMYIYIYKEKYIDTYINKIFGSQYRTILIYKASRAEERYT